MTQLKPSFVVQVFRSAKEMAMKSEKDGLIEITSTDPELNIDYL